MFTSANLAASRLSALENYECFKQKETAAAASEQQKHEQQKQWLQKQERRMREIQNTDSRETVSYHDGTLGKARNGKKPLGSALVSVAALISKLDEEQPAQWESRSAPTLQLKPIKKTDEALRHFLKRVEAARVSREDCSAETQPISEFDDSYDPQTITLDRVPAYEREVRRNAYSLLMKHVSGGRDFVTASDNRFNASTSILTAKAEALQLAERMLRQVDFGFTVNTPAWTLSTSETDNMPALLEACRTPLSVKVSVQDCQSYNKEDQMLKTKRPANEQVNFEGQEKSMLRIDGTVIPRIITGILEAAERMPRINVADVPVNAMSAATTVQ